jgi:hypothetical protein
MAKKYVVELDAEERAMLEEMVRRGKALARKRVHARVLLKADSGAQGPAWTDEQIAEALELGVRTEERFRQRFVEHGMEDALSRRQSPQPPRRKLDGAAEARLVQLACSTPPPGRRRWTIRLLADKMVELRVVDQLGRETVRTQLKKMRLSLG